ncbi:hypothetical protein LLEC1_02716 [Akanthomyces lecanii]|uniref:Uncharacterized protein n=1 Tax=Cordyceps confragosa TaxID=2714763 RepID=A0A179IF73_CORDF|nr:hypothetical protein LLEC1_02716 [Akanthomyces lecanii]
MIEDSLKKVVADAVPGTQIKSLQATVSPGLHQIYRATTHDGATIQFSLPLSPNRRVLRCEYGSIRSEAAILQWLLWLYKTRPKLGSPKLMSVDFEDKKELKNRIRAQAIARYLPKLLEHGVVGTMQRLQYNVITPCPGRVLSTLDFALTVADRRSVDFQIGQMLRCISLLRSPTSRFGTIESMLPAVPQRSNCEQRRASVQESNETFARWSDAFGEMLHNAIQDAQSNQITASYDSIRRFLGRFTHVLDTVVEPRLVLVDAGLDNNVLVALQEVENDNSDASGSGSGAIEVAETSGIINSSPSIAPGIRVTGIREWAKAIFGDPLLSIMLSQAPSEYLLSGFCASLVDTLDDMDEVSEALLQNRQHVQIRLNLYRIYHALNAISVEYIRRDEGSDPRELRARRALVEAVRELDTFDKAETSKRRRRRLEVAPSKRARTLSP